VNEIDSTSLKMLAEQHPNKAITFDNGFLDGDIKKPFGFIPNNWDGTKLYFSYKKDR
jgi:hypothetical protein